MNWLRQGSTLPWSSRVIVPFRGDPASISLCWRSDAAGVYIIVMKSQLDRRLPWARICVIEGSSHPQGVDMKPRDTSPRADGVRNAYCQGGTMVMGLRHLSHRWMISAAAFTLGILGFTIVVHAEPIKTVFVIAMENH